MKSSNIPAPTSTIECHGGVEFAEYDGSYLVHCEGEWVCISEADRHMIVGRVQAEQSVELSVKRTGAWLKFWFWNGKKSWLEVPLACFLDPGYWSMTDAVTIPDFDPERHVAQDPEPELHHPFAFVDSERSRGYFVRAHGEGEDVWVRVSKECWNQCMRLFHSNVEDDPDGEFYGHQTIWGVVANDEYRLVFLDVNPMGECGEIEFHVRGYFPTEDEEAA